MAKKPAPLSKLPFSFPLHFEPDPFSGKLLREGRDPSSWINPFMVVSPEPHAGLNLAIAPGFIMFAQIQLQGLR
jgi:hypothetical protein